MFLPILTLLWALLLSGTAAYFSIVGLAALFAAAFWPVVFMGVAIEGGKLLAATIVHHNWANPRYTTKHKTYLLSAVAAGMLVTALGIYGFLSKGHLEQEAPVAGVELQIERGEQRIKVLQDEIKRYEARQQQLDAVVQTLIDNKNIRGPNGATATRNNQEAERKEIQYGIDAAYKEIGTIQDELLPLRHQNVEVEAKLGPVKYVAELFGWSDAGTAVRFVIFVIMWCFDPLAIVLVISGVIGLEEAMQKRRDAEAERERIRKEEEAEQLRLRKIEEEEERKRQEEERIREEKAEKARAAEQRKLLQIELNNKYKKQAEDLKAQLDAVKELNEDAIKAVEENVHLKDELERKERELEALVNDFTSRPDLTADLEALEAQIVELNAKAEASETLAAEKAALEEQLAILAQEVASKQELEARIEEFREELNTLAEAARQKDELEARVAVLAQEIAGKRELEEQVGVLLQEVEVKKDLEVNLTRLSEELETAKNEVAQHNAEIAKLEQELFEARQIVTPEELAILQEELEAKQRELEIYHAEVERRNGELEERNRELEIVCAELEKKANRAMANDEELRKAINRNDRARVVEILERRPEILEDMITIITNYQKENLAEARTTPDNPDDEVSGHTPAPVKVDAVEVATPARVNSWLDFPPKNS